MKEKANYPNTKKNKNKNKKINHFLAFRRKAKRTVIVTNLFQFTSY